MYCFRARRARARGALVGEPRVADEMVFTVAGLAAVLVHAHAVVEHLSRRARAHFRGQVLAGRLPGSQRFVIIARLFAAGRTSLVQQS